MPGADKYDVYIRWSGETYEPSLYQTFTTNSGRLWTLIATKRYDLSVKAICGTTSSPMSAILVLP